MVSVSNHSPALLALTAPFDGCHDSQAGPEAERPFDTGPGSQVVKPQPAGPVSRGDCMHVAAVIASERRKAGCVGPGVRPIHTRHEVFGWRSLEG